MAGGWLRCPTFPASLPMVLQSKRQKLGSRRWRFVSSRTVLSTVRQAPTSPRSPSPLHDFLAERSRTASSRRLASNWLVPQATNRLRSAPFNRHFLAATAPESSPRVHL